MPAKDKIDPILMLPNMSHFVNEQALPLNGSRAEIQAEQITLWVKPQMTIRGHGDLAGLEPEPLPIMNEHPAIVYGIAKDRRCQSPFGGGQGTGGHESNISRLQMATELNMNVPRRFPPPEMGRWGGSLKCDLEQYFLKPLCLGGNAAYVSFIQFQASSILKDSPCK